jgi:hypothetical protein
MIFCSAVVVVVVAVSFDVSDDDDDVSCKRNNKFHKIDIGTRVACWYMCE